MESEIELVIEELLLTGFSPHDRYKIAGAFTRELQRLFSDQGFPPGVHQSMDTLLIDAGNFQLHDSSTPQEIGIHAAQTVFRGLSG